MCLNDIASTPYMRSVHEQISEEMHALADVAQAAHLMRFFKTGPGQYGEGDRFLGLRVPQTRALVKEYKARATRDDVKALAASPWHELRLAAFLLLIEIYSRHERVKCPEESRQDIDLYLSLLDRADNWDLVDLSAPKLLGAYMLRHPEERGLLSELAAMEGRLWHQRTAVVSTWTLICAGEYADTLGLCRMLLTHPHDLIHKATGWMLREVGKRGGEAQLLHFLDEHAPRMPRTALRYAIERLSPATRRHYLTRPRLN